MNPLVSVVIPCYRGRRYLAAAIESCLRQDYPALEVIVVDDASPTADAEVAQDYVNRDPRVRLIRRTTNGGVARAFNTGFAAARGAYFTRLAQDDYFECSAIRVLATALAENPTAGLVYADTRLVDADGRVMQFLPTNPPETALRPCNRVGLCVMWPRTAWESVGPFDPRFDLCEDYEFFLRIGRRFPLVRIEGEPLLNFRYHAEQLSITRARRHELALAALWAADAVRSLSERPLSPELWKKCLTSHVRWFVKKVRLLAAGESNRLPGSPMRS